MGNWFGSSEMQEAWMNEFGTIPCQQELLNNAPDDVKEFIDGVYQQEIDWKFVADNLDQWVEKVELEFMK